MQLANYVKFRRGLISDFEKLPIESREPDTLYFIYDENGESAELYLGARKISGEGSISTESISELKDIVITKVQNNDLLVYDDISQTWINQSLDEIFADFMVTTEPTIVSVENIYNNKHQDLIDQEFAMTDPKVGDIVIIKVGRCMGQLNFQRFLMEHHLEVFIWHMTMEMIMLLIMALLSIIPLPQHLIGLLI